MSDFNERIIKNLMRLSDNHHKLSLLFYELSRSLEPRARKMTSEEFRNYLKEDVGLDFGKITKILRDSMDIKLSDFKTK